MQVPDASDFDSAVPLRIRTERHNSLNNRFKPDPACDISPPSLPSTLHLVLRSSLVTLGQPQAATHHGLGGHLALQSKAEGQLVGTLMLKRDVDLVCLILCVVCEQAQAPCGPVAGRRLVPALR